MSIASHSSPPDHLPDEPAEEDLQAFRQAYVDAAMSGLCHEGALECARGAVRSLTAEQIREILREEWEVG